MHRTHIKYSFIYSTSERAASRGNQGSGFRVSLWGVLSFNCVRKPRLNEKLEMRNGGVAHKNIEAPRSFDSASRCRHFERSREIYMAERSLPDVRQHQDIVSPQHIHADSSRAVEIPRLRSG